MASEFAIEVEGFAELRAALAGFDRDVAKALTTDLKAAAEPVRAKAEQLMGSEIPHMKSGSSWTRARVGVTGREVYVVPVERGVRRKGQGPLGKSRPNLAGLAMDRAYEPALRQEQAAVVGVVEAAVDRAAARLR